MGTRGVFGFISGNSRVASYNHGDSYPSGLGVDVAKFVVDHVVKDPTRWAQACRNVVEVDQTEVPNVQAVPEDLRPRISKVSSNFGSGKPDWYWLLRERAPP